MDIKKEREAFLNVYVNYKGDSRKIQFNEETEQFMWRKNNVSDTEVEYVHLMNQRWYAWLACAKSKSQAVPRWISTSDRMPKEGEEVLVHNLGQVRQVTRDSKWAGGFKERNCYGWQAAYGQSHWMPKSIELPERYHFYYENDAKQKAMIEAQEQSHE